MNGEGLSVAPGGFVINGRHRLTAVVQTGLTIEFEVAYDVPLEALAVTDTGRPRRAADIDRIHGGTQSTQRMSIALLLLLLGNRISGVRSKITYLTLQPIADACGPEMAWAIEHYPNRIEPGIPSGGAPIRTALTWALKSGVPQETLAAFCDQVVNGCEKGTPAYALRGAISALPNGSTQVRYQLAIKALRAIELHIQGRPCALLKQQSEEVLDRMPFPDGIVPGMPTTYAAAAE